MDRYYLTVDIGEPLWQEVSKEQFVHAERLAGFHNTMGQPDEPATAGFTGGGLRGRVTYVREEDHELQT